MPNRIVGLDISARRLLAVEVQGADGKHPVLARAHAVALPEGAARDSEVLDVPLVSQSLKQLWREGGFRSKRVVLGVGNQRVLVRDHTVPVMPLAQLRQALPYQVAELLPVPVNETLLDFYPLSEVPDSEPPQMHGLLVAAIKESIETNVNTIEDAGLRVVGVDLSPFAIVRALDHAGGLAGGRTVAMIGDQTTFIIVVADGIPQFVRIVPAGGDTLTEAAAQATGLGDEQALALKRQIGLERGTDPLYTAVTDAMLGALRSIVGSIRSTNSYYLGNHPGALVQDVIVLGSETRVPGFVRALGELVGLPTSIGDPLSEVALSDDIDAGRFADFETDLAVPLGLALGNR